MWGSCVSVCWESARLVPKYMYTFHIRSSGIPRSLVVAVLERMNDEVLRSAFLYFTYDPNNNWDKKNRQWVCVYLRFVSLLF